MFVGQKLRSFEIPEKGRLGPERGPKRYGKRESRDVVTNTFVKYIGSAPRGKMRKEAM